MTFTKPKAGIACRHRTCCFEFGEAPLSSTEFVCSVFFLLKDGRTMAPGSVIASPLLSWKMTYWRPLLGLCSPQCSVLSGYLATLFHLVLLLFFPISTLTLFFNLKIIFLPCQKNGSDVPSSELI